MELYTWGKGCTTGISLAEMVAHIALNGGRLRYTTLRFEKQQRWCRQH